MFDRKKRQNSDEISIDEGHFPPPKLPPVGN